jgi:hypothetical protein
VFFGEIDPTFDARSGEVNIFLLIVAIFSLVALAAPLRASIDASYESRPLTRTKRV